VVEIVCLDLEGVLVPEIWINVAETTGIAALRVTTRDEPDYDFLMRRRLAILREHRLALGDLQEVIGRMGPLEGARDFLDTLRESFQVIVLSDTFYEFAKPLMRQLGWPTLFCHRLVVDDEGRIEDYRLRLTDQKRSAVLALRNLRFTVLAAGDSYNDTTMLDAADAGILFRPPPNVIQDFPQFRVTDTYAALAEALAESRDAVRTLRSGAL
jgi:phosphoserine / homoserine phosphotransferase